MINKWLISTIVTTITHIIYHQINDLITTYLSHHISFCIISTIPTRSVSQLITYKPIVILIRFISLI